MIQASSSPAESPLDRHNEEIRENLEHWKRKPELRRVYEAFYQEIAAAIASVEGPVLECGSGIGNLKSVLPDAITSDLFPNPWLDRQENVYALGFPTGTLGAVVLFDVFHHLEHPGTAMAELARVLRPGGRLVLFEPSMGLLGRTVLGLFHHEPLALRAQIGWHAPEDWRPAQCRYYAAQGNAWRIFGREDLDERLKEEWRLVGRAYFPALPWLLCGGFRGPRLLRGPAEPAARALERLLTLAPRFFSSRLLITLERR
jgi:SAM-dependent methyltransferase